MKILHRSIYEIDAGEMREIVYLLEPIETADGRGGFDVTYKSPVAVFALVHPGGNVRELQEANLTYDNIITIYMRYNDSLTEGWKINYRGDIYTLHKSSDVDAKKRFLQISAYTKA